MEGQESNASQNAPPPQLAGSSTTSTTTNGPYSASNQNPYASLATAMNSSQLPQPSYQSYAHMHWQNSWPVNPMYAGGASAVPPTSHHTYAPYQTQFYHPLPMQPTATATNTQSTTPASTSAPPNPAVKLEVDDKSTSPPPPPKYEHWDEAVREFLQNAGLIQALKGFECDMLVLNSEWERTGIPVALEKLIKGLSSTREFQSLSKGKARESPSNAEPEEDRSMEDRKLDYVHLASGERAQPPTSINREISAFLARNRARNDASNRAEFLLSLSEKRKRFQGDGDAPEDDNIPSCARTDARPIDREVQMKYDIARNDEGPLRRTKKSGKEPPLSPSTAHPGSGREPFTSAAGVIIPKDEDALPKHHPGIDERLSNIETHLAVRYVPSPPKTLWARLKFLEDHIIKLEKDYPPWAALHFNQPNRGWPPPPRATPIIVPPHLRSSEPDSAGQTTTPSSQPGHQSLAPPVGGQKVRNTKSSLQRAVLERLEVQQAMGERANS